MNAVAKPSRPVSQPACKPNIAPIRFDAIWNAYHGGHPSQAKDANGDLLYKDQCAIKLSVALHGAGVDMNGFTGAFTVIDGKRAALRAAELAGWLNKVPFCGLPMKPENVTGSDWKTKISGRTGIAYFSDYWVRDGGKASNPTGDHIDLWNKSTLPASIESVMRFQLGIPRVPNFFGPGNWYSNLDDAKTILFWEIR